MWMASLIAFQVNCIQIHLAISGRRPFRDSNASNGVTLVVLNRLILIATLVTTRN